MSPPSDSAAFELWRKKLSIARKGKKPMLGKHHSEATKKLIGSKSGYWRGKHRSEEMKRKLSAYRRGRPLSLEHRRSISMSLKGMFLGENGPGWRGGVTGVRRLIRTSSKYRAWRTQVFTRDKFCCLLCGRRGQLQADHHPKPFSQICQENAIKSLADAVRCKEFWNIDNGRTLCVECHRRTDTWGSRKVESPKRAA